MKKFFLAAAAVASVLVLVSVALADEGCPGADAWTRAHPRFDDDAVAARDAARTPSAPALLTELERRVAEDQKARHTFLAGPTRSVETDAVRRIDAENLKWLKKEIRRNGFPAAAAVGERGVHLAWVLLQHADADSEFRRSLVPVMLERFKAGELSPLDLARFVDRVLKAAGQPQQYGTQFDWQSHTFSLPPSGELTQIDRHRREIGLMPLADYACTMNRRLEKGPTE